MGVCCSPHPGWASRLGGQALSSGAPGGAALEHEEAAVGNEPGVLAPPGAQSQEMPLLQIKADRKAWEPLPPRPGGRAPPAQDAGA